MNGDRLEYTLFHLAAKAKYGGGYIIEALHLSDEVSEEATVTDAKQKFRKELTEEPRCQNRGWAISAGP